MNEQELEEYYKSQDQVKVHILIKMIRNYREKLPEQPNVILIPKGWFHQKIENATLQGLRILEVENLFAFTDTGVDYPVMWAMGRLIENKSKKDSRMDLTEFFH